MKKVIIVLLICLLLAGSFFIFSRRAIILNNVYFKVRNAKEVGNYKNMRKKGEVEDLSVTLEDVVKNNNKLEYTVNFKLSTEDAIKFLEDEEMIINFGVSIYDDNKLIHIDKFNSIASMGQYVDINYHQGLVDELKIKNQTPIAKNAKLVSKEIDKEQNSIKVKWLIELEENIDNDINFRIYNVQMYWSKRFNSTYSDNNIPYLIYPDLEWSFKKYID